MIYDWHFGDVLQHPVLHNVKMMFIGWADDDKPHRRAFEVLALSLEAETKEWKRGSIGTCYENLDGPFPWRVIDG